MTREEIVEIVNGAFAELDIPEEELAPEKKFFDDLGLDSLDMVDVVISLQRKFGVQLRGNEEIKKVVTMNDLYEFFVKIDAEKAKKWISNGAQPTETVKSLLKKSNIVD